MFLKLFGGIPGMFVDYFQIILNFFYVCQSISWLTPLLKIDKYTTDMHVRNWEPFEGSA